MIPATFDSMDPNQLRSLNCFVLGGREDEVFTVEIEKSKNLSILKDLIKEKMAHDLNDVDASDLELLNVSLPVSKIAPCE